MGLNLDFIDGQTPLEEDEKDGLLIQTIATRGELDEFEQLNIEEAMQWLRGKPYHYNLILNETFIRKLHVRMFGNVWRWAGTFRVTNKNIGIDKWQVPIALKDLCDDAIYWVEHESYPSDEIAIRLKHRIVSIHCFPNGNGRHSRLLADIMISNYFGLRPFSWGSASLDHENRARKSYLEALRRADCGDYSSLLDFARS
jgi:Fic-DOC domain mobile mystery protein B